MRNYINEINDIRKCIDAELNEITIDFTKKVSDCNTLEERLQDIYQQDTECDLTGIDVTNSCNGKVYRYNITSIDKGVINGCKDGDEITEDITIICSDNIQLECLAWLLSDCKPDTAILTLANELNK